MKATIYDVAKSAKVSISTVSRVLNNSGYVSEKTRTKVMTAVQDLNFHKSLVATALMKKSTNTVGLIIPDIKNTFYADLTRAIEDVANNNGYNVILCNTDNSLEKEAAYIQFLLQKSIDGIIFTTPEVEDKNIRELQELHPDFPMVLIGGRVEGTVVDEVLVDNFEGGYLAAQHLIQLGHRKIGFISGPRQVYSTIERLKGYEAVHKDSGMKVESEIIQMGEFKIQSGYHHALKLLKRSNRPTAIFAANDLIAVGVYQAARELGLQIPYDLSVIGFDDTEYASILTPMLTTIHSPIREMGMRGMEFAIKMLQGQKQSKETVVFRPTLVVRESTQVLQK